MSHVIAFGIMFLIIVVLAGYAVRLEIKLHLAERRAADFQERLYDVMYKFQPRFWSYDERSAFSDNISDWNVAFSALLQARHSEDEPY